MYYDKNGNPVHSFEEGVVEVSKTIKKLPGENEFRIDLEVKTKNEVQVNKEYSDAAVVLVMDVSNSMNYHIDRRTRLDVAKAEAKKFLEEFAKNAGNAKRYVSIVQFGSSAQRIGELYVDVNSGNGLNKAKQYIDRASAGFYYKDDYGYSSGNDSGGTDIEAGLALGRNIIKEQDFKDIANKSVILLTDGNPTVPVGYVSNPSLTFVDNGYNYTGRVTNREDVDDLNNIVNSIKAAQAKVYAISFAYGYNTIDVYESGVGEPYGYYLLESKPVHEWYTSRVGVDEIYDADNSATLMKAFANISTEIETEINTSGLEITDPMGQYILFDSSNTQDASHKFEGNTLTWLPVAEASQSGKIKTYKYSYKVKLDTAAPGFEGGKEYLANGRTTLSFVHGDSPVKKTVDFTIPSVKGEIPEVEYSVEYYKWDKTTKSYPTEPTKAVRNLKAKLWEQVNAPEGYETEYARDDYHFVEGDSVLQLQIVENGSNVLKLMYQPDVADVLVNHYYKTDVIDVNGNKIPGEDYVLGTSPSYKGLYVGDKFEASLVAEYGGVTYTLNTVKSDNRNITVKKSGNVINLYYDGIKDERAKGSVVVNAIYKTGSWQIDPATGRYKEVYSVSQPQEVEKSTDISIPSDYSTRIVEKNGYKFESTDNGEVNAEGTQVVARLTQPENVINLTYSKPADKKTLNPVDVLVKHKYYLTEKKVVDGKLVTVIPSVESPTAQFEVKETGYYAGESYTPVEILDNNGITYVADASNAGKLKTYKLENGTLVVELSYHQTKTPTPTKVTVNHTYRTYDKVYSEVTDGEGKVIGHKVEVVLTDEKTVTEEVDKVELDGKKEDLYSGFDFVAEKKGTYNGKSYIFNGKESTPDGRITLEEEASENIINLYYDAEEDNREAADITVKHVYVTKHTTIENGKVVNKVFTHDAGMVDPAKDFYAGKAGDLFTVTPSPEFSGDSYVLKDSGQFEAKLVLAPGTQTVTLTYERETSDLKATALKAVHKYIKRVMTVVDGVVGYYGTEDAETVAVVNDFTVDGGKKLPETVFAGEKYSVDLRTTHDGVVYTPDASNPSGEIVLSENADDNSLTFKYEIKEELQKVTVTVKHHYKLTTINEVGESSISENTSAPETVEKYVGEVVKLSPNHAGYNFDKVVSSVEEGFKADAAGNVAVTTGATPVTVDYYYTKTVDNSVKANWTINHYYRTLDWNDGNDKEYTLDSNATQKGSSFASKTLTGVPELKVDSEGTPTYSVDKATFVAGSNPEKTLAKDSYTVELADGENTINFYYSQKIDTRKDTSVKVIHNYYRHDVSGLVKDTTEQGTEGEKTLPGVLAGTYEEVFTGKADNVWIGGKFTAKQRPNYGTGEAELAYKFLNSNPANATIEYLVAEDSQNPNVIVMNYVYDYDARENVTMIIDHIYRTTDTYKNTTTEEKDTVTSKFGNNDFGTWVPDDNTFTAKELLKSGFTRVTSDGAMTVTYNAGENRMTVVYERIINTKPPKGGGGGGSTPPSVPTTPGVTPDTPTTVIPDTPTPLGEPPVNIADEQPPLSDAPQIIEDTPVPLGALPQTGGTGPGDFFAVGIAAILLGLCVRLRRKEEQ